MPEYQRITPRRVPITRPLGTGLVLLTSHPVIQSEYRPLPNTRRPKESLASKGVLYAELETGHGVLRVVNVHLGIGHEEPLRAHHEHFLRLLDSYGDVHLICGDFNQAASARSQYYRPGEIHLPFVNDELRRRGFEDALVKQHGSSADEMVTVDSETNPLLESGYHVRLDYIWYRSGAGLLLAPKTAHLWLDRPVEGTFVSDHFGVQSQFEIRPGS